jgi:hypothetical protein
MKILKENIKIFKTKKTPTISLGTSYCSIIVSSYKERVGLFNNLSGHNLKRIESININIDYENIFLSGNMLLFKDKKVIIDLEEKQLLLCTDDEIKKFMNNLSNKKIVNFTSKILTDRY